MTFYPSGGTDWTIDRPTEKPFGKRTNRLRSDLADWLGGDLTELAAGDVTDRSSGDICERSFPGWTLVVLFNILKL